MQDLAVSAVIIALTILVLTALAKQFGVAYQHTKVFVKSSTRILKSPEGWDRERYLTEINKAI